MAGSTRTSRNRQGEPIPLAMDSIGIFEAFAQWMVQLGGTGNNLDLPEEMTFGPNDDILPYESD